MCSLSERGGLDPVDLMERHLEWFRANPPDVGTNIARVLRRLERPEDATDVARAVWEERGPEVSAGNGSVMYCAPLGLAYANRPGELFELAPTLSGITHFDERCKTAVLAITLTIASMVRGEPAEAAARSAVDAALAREGGEELEFLVDAAGSKRQIDGPDQGFCLFTAGVALQALVRGGDFETEIRRVVSLGGDADTNAAVAGALVGARDGLAGLPATWLERLVDRDAIRAEAEALVQLAELGA
jgi:ADP-ribosyl-[dinitrogen reductase] hydrolase